MASLHVLIVFLLCVSCSFSQDIRVGMFHQGSVCNITERLRLNCSQEITGDPSVLDCHRNCLDLESCNGVSFDTNGACILHKDCPYLFECNGADISHQHTERYCLHGTRNPATHSCDCLEGYSGDRCQIHPPACNRQNNGDENRFFADPEQNGLNPFPVTCNGGSPYVIVLRNKGEISFNRTWEEYKNGFYIDDFHQWIGLTNWKRLNNVGCDQVFTELVLDGVSFSDSRKYSNRRYTDFSLLDETDSFKFSFNNNGNLDNNLLTDYDIADCWSAIQNTLFSTWDQDNDGDAGENCAASAGSGGWYTAGCVKACNMLGLGTEFWSSTPSAQHMKLDGADLLNWWSSQSYMEIYLRKCLRE